MSIPDVWSRWQAFTAEAEQTLREAERAHRPMRCWPSRIGWVLAGLISLNSLFMYATFEGERAVWKKELQAFLGGQPRETLDRQLDAVEQRIVGLTQTVEGTEGHLATLAPRLAQTVSAVERRLTELDARVAAFQPHQWVVEVRERGVAMPVETRYAPRIK